MTKWLKEDYAFKITVTSVKGNGNPVGHCRNGHEVGDTYTCEYGAPGGFCSKSMFRLFSLMEAVRAGGDLSKLLMGASKNSGEFSCHDGVVNFRLEAIEI
jgi:uncharacterized repeat protein (TIGR04076 family)